jgi:hypothetical protein
MPTESDCPAARIAPKSNKSKAARLTKPPQRTHIRRRVTRATREARFCANASEKPVQLELADGETLTIAADDVPRVCENLWCFAPNVDALVVAGVVVAVSREFTGIFPLELTRGQSRLIRQAMAQPEAA